MPVRSRLLSPDDFSLSDEVRPPLRAWLDTWNDNFSVEPHQDPHTWRRGFDVKNWMRQGDQISSMIEDELPEYYVHRTYWTYLGDISPDAGATPVSFHDLQRTVEDAGTDVVAIHADRRREIILYPDYGSSWGLRSDHPLARPEGTAQLRPEHFTLSEDVTTLLRAWLDTLNSNFADVPRAERQTWKKGFNVREWARLGDQICSMIEDELPEHYVHRLYWSYNSLYRNYRMNPTTRNSLMNERRRLDHDLESN